jgi:hypothetical protein
MKMAKRIRTLLKQFLASNNRNLWMNGSGLAVYVRKSIRLIEDRMVPCLDIANMQAQRPGRGTGGRFIEDAQLLNPYEAIFIECVQNERLASRLERTGWIKLQDDQAVTPCFYRWNIPFP